MVEFVAVDAASADRGTQFFNVGVLLEISGGSEFDEHYFSTMESVSNTYDISTQHKVLKSNDIQKQTPSYDIPAAREQVIEGILSNPAIQHIYVTIGYFNDEINPPWHGGTKKGSKFTKGWMAQLFEILTLWRYSDYRYDHLRPEDAWIDDVSGKICPAWSYVNRDYDLSIAPHGDRIYPSLASADVLAGYLSRTLPLDKDLDELSNAAYGTLMGKAEDMEIEIELEAADINSEHKDAIVPHHPYQIGGELHFARPVLFVHSTNFESSANKVLSGTDFYSHVRRWAYENRGCFKILQEHEFSENVKDGDAIAYTAADTPSVCETLVRLNQEKSIELLSADDLAEQYRN